MGANGTFISPASPLYRSQASIETRQPARAALSSQLSPAMSSDAPTLAIDSGHTAWMLVSMALVQLMLPGLAFFYAGLLHRKSVVTMIMQNYGAMGVITIVWFIVGYSLCFSADSGQFFGNPATHFFFRGVDGTPWGGGIPTLVFAGYQGMFAVITPALMTECSPTASASRPTSSSSASGSSSSTRPSATGSGVAAGWLHGAFGTLRAASSCTRPPASRPSLPSTALARA